MLPNFLASESVRREDGFTPELPLESAQGKALLFTLGITRIIEQESLDVSIWGSVDGQNWGEKPIASYPQKFYCGVYSILVDLSEHPDVKVVRAGWKMNRWGRGDAKPVFGFYLFVQETEAPVLAKASA
jgi:hypothetical protein